MCNEYHARNRRQNLTDAFAQLKIPIHWTDAEANRDPDQPLKPTDRATILRAVNSDSPAAGLEGIDVRWWMIPAFHRGPAKDWRSMCTNARLETVDTAPTFRDAYKRRRCLVPVTSFVEYDEPPGWKKGKPKRRNEITWAGGDVRYFAGLWEKSSPADMPEGLESFAFITGPAPPDIEPIHDRTPPTLTLEQGMEWLRLDGPGKAPFYELPIAGSYTVTEAVRDAVISREMRRLL